MTAVSVGTTSTVISAVGYNEFVSIFNNGAQTVFLSFDGTPATLADGYPLLQQTGITLHHKYGVTGIVAATTADVRVQKV